MTDAEQSKAAWATWRLFCWSSAQKLPISPLVGEMPGRAEGGAVPPACQTIPALPCDFCVSRSSSGR
ncbi:hypothetical protein FJ963_10085 [Mesorhizobium sp. B2-1-4]|nr:hypothetical protein FJ551_24800 [Mesorhizobium sp. B2-5-1]TPM65049.1 hypothetical protein FJ962_06360 [Mesorhizobium sp. B2-1-9]TPM86843.1 hypothetical protein FJ963_10085 [Mesorhizobium sp. B2-1-4]TPN14365.1 hypothetical protein FJ971_01985 [Mesorhizobium sp. B2-1-2]